MNTEKTIPAHLTLPRNMRGAKWFNNCTYLTDSERADTIKAIAQCKECYPGERVGVRVATYIGEPAAVCTIEYGAGQRIFCMIYPQGIGY